MTEQALPEVLEKVFATNSEPDAVFSALLPALCEVLQGDSEAGYRRVDRCFLYLRNPYNNLGKIPYCWLRTPQYPDVSTAEWAEEPESLPKEDPLFAAALRTEASIFVEDVETASPEVVNLAFEQKHFGHRALIHAHLCQDGVLWGILQPALFGQPRVWTQFERSVIAQVTEKITPLAVAYVKAAGI
jgi:GAF domain-containing protein